DQQLERWRRTRRVASVVGGMSMIAVVFACLGLYAWNAKTEAEQQKMQLEVALARTSLRPLSQSKGPLIEAETEALTQLAGWRDSPDKERIAERFLKEALSDSPGRHRLGVRGRYALHAMIGLDRKKREQTESLLLTHLSDADLSENDRAELAAALLALGGI